MIFRAFFFMVLTVFSTYLFATTQTPENLIYNGKEYSLYILPLHEYFKKYPNRRPRYTALNTGLWRGYIATFEIKNNELFLKDIKTQLPFERMPTHRSDIKWKSVLPEVLAGQFSLKLDWFSKLLIVGDGNRGKCLNGFPGGFMANYENYILIEIKNGNFVKEMRMNCLEFEQFRNRGFKENYDDYDSDWWSELWSLWRGIWCEKVGRCE